MDMNGCIEILNKVCVENYDDGFVFTNEKRLNAIKDLLLNSKYKLINKNGLFKLYGKRELRENDKILLVSSHVDCHPNITKCYSSEKSNTTICGTYDNAVTNAAALNVMIDNELSDNVFFAFTGDEEFESRGAISLMQYLNRFKVEYQCVILDVTDMGWTEQADFTVENNFWNDTFGNKVIKIAQSTNCKWCFVPSEPEHIPCYVPCAILIPKEAEEDESWVYDENDVECFSLCLPCYGEMHSNKGVNIRKESYLQYIATLECFLKELICN